MAQTRVTSCMPADSFPTVRKKGPDVPSSHMVGVSLAEAIASAGAEYEAQNPSDAKRQANHMAANAPESPAKSQRSNQGKNTPPAMTWADFTKVLYPARNILIEPILATREIAMLYADPGAGKSRFALMLAVCLAGGVPCLKWKIPQPKKVLYVEGELPGHEFQERIKSAIRETGAKPELVAQNFGTWTELPDFGQIPPLNSKTGREEFLERAKGYDVVIIDSLFTLTRFDEKGATKCTEELNATLRALRDLGCAVLAIHHAGKGGSFYGNMLQNVLTSLTVKLCKIADEVPVEGCHFTLNFEKTRNITGRDAEPLDVKCERGVWTFTNAIATEQERALEYYRLGMSQKDIAAELGKSQGTISKWLKGVEKPKKT